MVPEMTDEESKDHPASDQAHAWLTDHHRQLEARRDRWRSAGSRCSWARLATFLAAVLVWYPLAQRPSLAAIASRKQRFGEYLTRLMQVAGLSQRSLAGRLNVTQSCISQFASGKHKPQPETLERLAKALGCAVTDLWPADDAGP